MIIFSFMFGDGAFSQTQERSAAGEVCNKSYREIYREASPSVVFISVKSINPYRLQNRVQRGLGSGFIFHRDGLILTNSHVVFGAQTIAVTLDNGDSHPAELVGADPIFDLAVIRIAPPAGSKPPALALGRSAALRVGDEVDAIGNPLGLDQTLTTGVVSALDRILPETPLSLSRRMIQTDTAINPGNSGGPLLNRCGEAIGINTAGILQAQNIGFAVPVDLAKSVLSSLVSQRRVIRPWIGFHGKLVGEEINRLLNVPIVPGLLVEVVEPGSPAEKAKIRGGYLDVSIAGEELLIGGDIVTTINGIPLNSEKNLIAVMQDLKVGGRLQLQLFHSGNLRNIKYRLPERPLLPGDIQQ